MLFVDYVRMLRACKGVDLAAQLPASDMPYLRIKVDPAAWYPMTSFERFGNAILRLVAKDSLMAVELWGRFSAGQLRAANPTLLKPGDPVETLNRFHVLRQTFFDFGAVEVVMLHDGEAEIAIGYHMGMPAEEAAAHQTKGFFEGLLELSGAREVTGTFRDKSWDGAPRTRLELKWLAPPDR